MADANWDSANLKAVLVDGLIREDVMDQIFDISRIPLPFTDMIGSDTIGNSFFTWTTDRLAAPDLTNAKIDGADTTADDDSKGGLRVGNHAQISTKTVQVSTRARESNSIGRSDELAYQVSERQKELRRDVEAITLSAQASIADDGSAVAGTTGGVGAWIETTTDRGATGADGGFNTTTKVVDAPTPGTVRALSEATVRDMAQGAYVLGANPTVIMSVPGVIRAFSEYMFTSSARIATLEGKTSADSGTSALTAKGAVNVFLSDFGSVLELTPNRLQQLVTTDNADVFILTPSMWRHSFIHGYRTEPLSKTGLADKRQMIVDWGLKSLNEEASANIADINPALPAEA